jgi:hypothetical protein
MLRGTVYTVVNGVPIRREVFELALDSPIQFEQAASTRVLAGGGAPPGATVEFGPITAPWGPAGPIFRNS